MRLELMVVAQLIARRERAEESNARSRGEYEFEREVDVKEESGREGCTDTNGAIRHDASAHAHCTVR